MRTLQEFCVFCCHKCHIILTTHYIITIYTDNRNNIQKISHFHAATPPQKHTKTPSSKQLFDLQSKTTRHFPQNDTLFSVKRYVVFYKMTRCFQQNDTMFLVKRHVVFGMMKYFQPHPLWHLWQQKNKTPSTGARIHARVRTPFGQYPTIPSSNQTNPSTPPPFRFPPHKNIHLRRHIHQQWNNHRQIIAQNQDSFALLTHLFRKVKMTKQNIDKEKTAQICRFFTLWGYFYPYIIGSEQSGNY